MTIDLLILATERHYASLECVVERSPYGGRLLSWRARGNRRARTAGVSQAPALRRAIREDSTHGNGIRAAVTPSRTGAEGAPSCEEVLSSSRCAHP